MLHLIDQEHKEYEQLGGTGRGWREAAQHLSIFEGIRASY